MSQYPFVVRTKERCSLDCSIELMGFRSDERGSFGAFNRGEQVSQHFWYIGSVDFINENDEVVLRMVEGVFANFQKESILHNPLTVLQNNGGVGKPFWYDVIV